MPFGFTPADAVRKMLSPTESDDTDSDSAPSKPAADDEDAAEDTSGAPKDAAASGAVTGDETNKGEQVEEEDEEEDEDEGEDENKNDGGEDDDDGEEEEVYVVEKIIKHAVADNEVIIYMVKWKDYPTSENTWESEDNLEGAKDLLQVYFNKIGGRPFDETNPRDALKKRGRKSIGAEPPSKRTKNDEVPIRPARGRKPNKKDEVDEEAINWPVVTADSNWTPPKPRKDSWEDILLKIEALESDTDGTKWAFVLWSIEDHEGHKRTSKVLLDSVSVAAPQATIKFYESHLVFAKTGPGEASNGAEG